MVVGCRHDKVWTIHIIGNNPLHKKKTIIRKILVRYLEDYECDSSSKVNKTKFLYITLLMFQIIFASAWCEYTNSDSHTLLLST